jgi:hypothetical protein
LLAGVAGACACACEGLDACKTVSLHAHVLKSATLHALLCAWCTRAACCLHAMLEHARVQVTDRIRHFCSKARARAKK